MKKRWFLVVILFLSFVGIGFWANRSKVPPSVRTTVLVSTRVEETVSCTGIVEAKDGVGVFAPVACRIREVCVAEGQRVQRGDVLAIVDKEATLAVNQDVAVQVALAAMKESIVAPEDGIVVNVSAKVGETLKVGTPCVVLARPTDLQIRIAIREKDLRVLREGMPVRISGAGLEQSTYEGVLSEISCAASSSGANTVVSGTVTPSVEKIDASFRLGLTTKATVVTSVTERGILVPYEAIVSDEDGSFFYLVRNNSACMYRINESVQLPGGVLLTDEALDCASVVLEPEKVGKDGAEILEATS